MITTIEKELADAEERTSRLRALHDLLSKRDTLAGEVATLRASKEKLEAERAKLEHDAKTREKFKDEDMFRAAQAGTFLHESTKLPAADARRFDLQRRFLRLRNWTGDPTGWRWRDAAAAADLPLEQAWQQQLGVDMQPLRAGLLSAVPKES